MPGAGPPELVKVHTLIRVDLGSRVPNRRAVPRYGQACFCNGIRAPVIEAWMVKGLILERGEQDRVLTLRSRRG